MSVFEIKDSEINVEEIMKKIRAEIERKKAKGFYPKDLEEKLATQLKVGYSPDNLETHLNQMNFSWNISAEPSIASNRRYLAPLIILIKKFIRRLLFWYFNEIVGRIVAFNQHTLKAIDKVIGQLDILQSQTQQLQSQTQQLQSQTQQLQSQTQQLQSQLGQLEELEVSERLKRMERRTNTLQYGAEAVTSVQGSVEDKTLQIQEETEYPQLDYFLFEYKHRGGSKTIREKQAVFAPYFINQQNVLDVGCGRGEFLELLKEQNIDSYGIDVNIDMVLECREKGLKVEQAEALSHLKSLPDESLGGIFLGQVLEHLSSMQLMQLVELSYKKLKSGAYFIAETINPLNLSVFANTFYVDLSHEKPIHPEAIKFLLQFQGFKEINFHFFSPIPEEEKLALLKLPEGLTEEQKAEYQKLNKNIDRLNNLLYGYQDYAVIAKK